MFSSTFFNQHKLQFESGASQTTSSNLYYSLPSTTNRSEEINRYLGSANLCPINIPEKSFETKENVSFDPSKLDFNCQEKDIMTEAVVKMLKKIIDMSNANLIENANGLLSKKMLTLMSSGLERVRNGCLKASTKSRIDFLVLR